MEAAPKEIVADAVNDAIRLGAIGFDAVKSGRTQAFAREIVLARIEKRPPRLNLASYPYLPQTSVRTTLATDYAVRLSGSAA
jgi:hypothetical protein